MTDPILVDLPSSVATNRLLLRPPQAGDGPLFFAAITESLPELRRFLASLPPAPVVNDLDAIERFFARP